MGLPLHLRNLEPNGSHLLIFQNLANEIVLRSDVDFLYVIFYLIHSLLQITFKNTTYVCIYYSSPTNNLHGFEHQFPIFSFPFNSFFLLFSMMWFAHLSYDVVFPIWHIFLSLSLIYRLLHSCSPRRILSP